MSSKKKTAAQRSKPRRRAEKLLPETSAWSGDLPGENASNGSSRECQQIKNPQTGDDREKRLAKRDALTLRAFQIAYENHHRKAS